MTKLLPCLPLGLALLLPLGPCPAHAQQTDSFTRARKELRRRRRRIIFNNDGCDALYFPEKLEANAETLLARRTAPLADSQVDSVFYCSISSGFSNFTHRTTVGSVLLRQVPEELGIAGQRNITGNLIDQGTDPLQAVLDWCRENDRECFWSFRMNDTHDGAHRPDKPYPLFPELKEKHPEYMIGTFAERPKHGAYTAVDYTLPEIRELAFRYVEEVCRNYDVDGIELDFFRHLSYLKGPAFGKSASQAELDLMTGLMQRIRGAAETAGRKRKRPILIAVRVPDSVAYCRQLGLDLEQWLEGDLVDLLIGGGYFQLNPWEYLVELGHRYGVAVYAGLSESRVKGDAPPFRRNSVESYRARAMRAWQAGVDGIYLFNFFNPKAKILREIGDRNALQTLDKIYYATIRNGDPDRYVPNGRRWQTVPVLTPRNPLRLPTGKTRTVNLAVGEDWAQLARQGISPRIECHLQASGAEALRVAINDTPLGNPQVSGVWTTFTAPAELFAPGLNRVELTAVPRQPAADTKDEAWNVVFDATEKPTFPWVPDRRREGSVVCELREGALFIADRGKKPGDYFYYSYPWNIAPEAETVAEVRVKVVSGWNNIIVANGVAYERVALYPDHIAFYEAKLSHEMDTTDAFHTYRVVLRGKDIRVYVDGELRLDGTGRFTRPLPERNDIRIGAANSPNLGEAYWQSVKLGFAAASVSLFDLVLSVRY